MQNREPNPSQAEPLRRFLKILSQSWASPCLNVVCEPKLQVFLIDNIIRHNLAVENQYPLVKTSCLTRQMIGTGQQWSHHILFSYYLADTNDTNDYLLCFLCLRTVYTYYRCPQRRDENFIPLCNCICLVLWKVLLNLEAAKYFSCIVGLLKQMCQVSHLKTTDYNTQTP